MGNDYARTKRDEELEVKRKKRDEDDDQMRNLRLQNLNKDPILDIIYNLTPKSLLRKDYKHFFSTYRLKKKLSTAKDLIYKIMVIQNIHSGRLFNAKIIKKSEIFQMGKDNFRLFYSNELRALENFKHPHVENVLDVYCNTSVEDTKLVIITGYTSKFSLLDAINLHIKNNTKFEDREISIIMKVLFETIYKFKSMEIIHRNLCPENIFFQLDDNYYTLCLRNFYFSSVGSPTAKGVIGALTYMSPEMLKDGSYDYKTDIWSLGVIFYMLVTLENPLSAYKSRERLLEAIRSKQVFKDTIEFESLDYNPEACKLMLQMLNDDPYSRISFEMIIEHNFLKEHEKLYLPKENFNKFINIPERIVYELMQKIENIPDLHNLVFYMIYKLKDFFLEVEELMYLNEFYKYLDKDNDGHVMVKEIQQIIDGTDGYLNNGDNKGERYANLLMKITNCDFKGFVSNQNSQIPSPEKIEYNFFIVANILISLYREKHEIMGDGAIIKKEYISKQDNLKTQEANSIKRIRIMFNEIDTDGSKGISISELQNLYKIKYDVNVKEILDKVRQNKGEKNQPGYFRVKQFLNLRTTENKEKNIEDDFSFEQIAGFFYYDFIKIDEEQNEIINKKCEEIKIKRDKLVFNSMLTHLNSKGI